MVDRKTDVLTVPVLAVLQYKGKDHITEKIDDQFVQTEVELGVSNEKYVEVLKGVKEGDVVAMSPMSLMTDEEKREAFGAASKGGNKDWGEEGAERDRREPVVRPLARSLPAGPAYRAKAADAGKGGQSAGQGEPGRSRRCVVRQASNSEPGRTSTVAPPADERRELLKKAGSHR